MKWQYRILFTDTPGGGSGAGGSTQSGGSEGSGGSGAADKTIPEGKFNEVVAQRDELKKNVTTLQTSFDEMKAKLDKIEEDKLKASGKTEELLTAKETELAATKVKLTEIETALSEAQAESEKTTKKIRKGLIDQLPDAHKGIADAIGDIEKLSEYVKLNASDKQILDGSLGGGSLNDIAAKSWNEMTVAERQKLKDGNPALYQKKLDTRNDKKT